MKVLPRYTPLESGVGCEAHADPACLCDVVVVNPVEIKHIPFHSEILNELGDDTINGRNLHEYLRIVIGIQKNVWLVGARAASRSDAWSFVPTEVADALRQHAYGESEWKYASMELEDMDLSDAQIAAIQKLYRLTLNGSRHRSRQAGERRAFHKPLADASVPHGTPAAVRRHRRANEPKCSECLEFLRDKKAKNRASRVVRGVPRK